MALAIAKATERLRPSEILMLDLHTGERVPLRIHNERLKAAALGLVPLFRSEP